MILKKSRLLLWVKQYEHLQFNTWAKPEKAPEIKKIQNYSVMLFELHKEHLYSNSLENHQCTGALMTLETNIIDLKKLQEHLNL